MKKHFLKTFWVFLFGLLTACGSASPSLSPTETSAATQTLPATRLPKPTNTLLPPTPTEVPIPPELARLQIAYSMLDDGHLYLWESGNPTLQLTDNRSRDRIPRFTEDGERIVFLRGAVPHNLYVINLDGSQEMLLISASKLSDLHLSYDAFADVMSYTFIPGTHQILFNTRHLDERDIYSNDINYSYSTDNHDLLIVDIDTGEIRQILPPGQCEHFYVAPTGDKIAIRLNGQINLVDLEGQTIRRNLFAFTPTKPYPLYPAVHWTEDGSTLIVTVPDGTDYDFDGPVTRTTWRIAADGSSKTKLPFDPPLLSIDYKVSPDGNWVLYLYYYYPGKTDENIPNGLYLGNLHDGSSQLLSEAWGSAFWNAASTHFLSGDNMLFLGTVDGQSILIFDHSRLLQWVDDQHFLFYTFSDDKLLSLGSIDGTAIPVPFTSYNQMRGINAQFTTPP